MKLAVVMKRLLRIGETTERHAVDGAPVADVRRLEHGAVQRHLSAESGDCCRSLASDREATRADTKSRTTRLEPIRLVRHLSTRGATGLRTSAVPCPSARCGAKQFKNRQI